jgi:hypothetical protein
MFTLSSGHGGKHHRAGVSWTQNVKRIGTSAPNAQEREEDRLQYSGKVAKEMGSFRRFLQAVFNAASHSARGVFLEGIDRVAVPFCFHVIWLMV